MPAFTALEHDINSGKEYELSDEIYTKCLLLGVAIRASGVHEGKFILIHTQHNKSWTKWDTLNASNIVYFDSPEEALEYWISSRSSDRDTKSG